MFRKMRLEAGNPDFVILPEMLDSIGIRLTNEINLDPRQKYSMMGQMRITEWINKHRKLPAAVTRVKR